MADMVDKIIAWESGEMTDEEALAFFQELVDSGEAWKLQGQYGRTAQMLLDRGLIKHPGEKKGGHHESA